MIEMTVLQFLRDEIEEDTSGCYLYAFRDGDTVFYIGQSKYEIVSRLWEHFSPVYSRYAGIRLGPTKTGEFIELNYPQAFDWHIQLMTLQDCEVITGNHYELDFRYAVLFCVEGDLIDLWRPILNGTYNSYNGNNGLPKKYKYPWRERVKEIVAAHKSLYNE